ncbi:MAG: CehA/McbA family metallohydrolase [Anaerolineae bacterium]|nr:CehA/McbA family metallohydrolase [Anaerolineae bacterium]
MDDHFEGHLTTHDCKRYIPHTFAVPAGCGRIDIDFRYAPQRVQGIKNLLTLTLFDPHGFRGARHRSGTEHHVTLSASEATPGYFPGPLPAGTWIVEVDTHMIMPGETVHYTLDVTLTEGAAGASVPPRARATVVARSEPGWYRGDLHTHSDHSDAHDFAVADLIQMARDAGLDFVFLTDHNTVTGLPEMDASVSETLLTAGGMELTTYWGHALCLGAREWVDWRIHPGDGEMARIAAATYANAQVFVIAHPLADGEPGCTGCSWRFGEMMPGNARVVEIWNGPWGCDSNNEKALTLWYDWLNQGLRLAATAGSDTHGLRDYASGPGYNVIYAEALSEAALLKAVLAGHLYLSAGPQLAFEAQSDDGTTWMMGDTVTQPVTFAVHWRDCPPDAVVRVIVNGRLLHALPAGVEGVHSWSMTPDQANWVTVEMRDKSGVMLAVTNPIFLDNA